MGFSRLETLERSSSPDFDGWLEWQLLDSAFPVGGFAHSSGVEAAFQHGEINSRDELMQFVASALQQIARSNLPFVSHVHRQPADFFMVDRYCDFFTSNHVANRASRLQGKTFLASTVRIFSSEPLRDLARNTSNEEASSHFAPIFGAVLSLLEIRREVACRIFLFIHLRALLSSAVRLGIVGPLEGQGIQHQLSGQLDLLLEQTRDLSFFEAAQTSPLNEIWQASQDRLYSRLFQS